MLLKESVDRENLCLDMVLLHEEDDISLIEDKKERKGAEGTHLSEPQKAHAMGEFAIVA